MGGVAGACAEPSRGRAVAATAAVPIAASSFRRESRRPGLGRTVYSKKSRAMLENVANAGCAMPNISRET